MNARQAERLAQAVGAAMIKEGVVDRKGLPLPFTVINWPARNGRVDMVSTAPADQVDAALARLLAQRLNGARKRRV